MADVNDALQWAARGFRVFPILPGDKVPPKGMHFKEEATTDAAKIRAWWRALPNYNYAVHCGDDCLVVDVDPRKGGLDSLFDLTFTIPHTLTVRTPGGGVHFYLRGPDVQNSIDRLGPGLDIRSAGGFVVGPGSFFADPGGKKGYTGPYTIDADAVVADAPEALILACGLPHERERGPPISIDAENDIMFAQHYLQKDAPIAIEGGGGNAQTFKVAAHVMELGLSTKTAAALMLEVWNDRCLPPWSASEIEQIVDNAAEYMTGTVGGRSADAERQGFDALGIVDAPTQAEQAKGKFCAVFAVRRWMTAEQILADDWLMHRMVMRRKTAMIAGPGAAGKSSITLAIAAHLACGASFVGHHVDKPCRVVVANAEDSEGTMVGRLIAVCATYGLDLDQVQANVLLWPGDYGAGEHAPPKFKLYTAEHKPAVDDVRELARELKGAKVDVVILDPLAKLHSENENDNVAMGAVMEAADHLARLADVGVLLVHHAGKGDRAAGEANAARGASVITTSARIVKTLYPADATDAQVYNLSDGFRSTYCRLDDAKINDASMATAPQWFERQSFPLPNTTTYALRPMASPKVHAEGERAEIATALYDFLQTNSKLEVETYQAAKALLAEQPHFRERFPERTDLVRLQQTIENRLSVPFAIPMTDAKIGVIARMMPGGTKNFVEITGG